MLGVVAEPPQATPLLWVDFGALFADSKEAEKFCVDAGTQLYPCYEFGATGSWMRINVGSHRAFLLEALKRVAVAYKAREK